MKKSNQFLTILVLAFGVVIPASANLLTNPDFETGNASGWTWTATSGTFATATVTTASKHSGTYGFETKVTANAAANGYLQQVLAGLTPGASYTVSAWIKWDATDVYNRADKFRGYLLAIGGGADVRSPAHGANSRTWQQYTVSQTANGSGNLTVRLVLNTDSAVSKIRGVYFDDIDVTADVVAAPTKLVYTSVPGSGNVGVPFNVTVQSQDPDNNPANVTSTTTVTLTVASGSGSLGGTTVGQILNGENSVVISGVTYDTADTMTLTATASGGDTLDPVTSGNIVFTDPPKTLHWGENDGNWTAANVWYDTGTAGAGTYSDSRHDDTVLEDTHSGTGDRTITLNDTVSPGSIGMTASKNFSITGAGTIAGTIGMTKDGTGTVTLGTSNTFSGDTRIAAGSLVVDNSSALAGSAVNLLSTDTGTLAFGSSVTTAYLAGLKGSDALPLGRDIALTNTAGGAVSLTVGGNNLDTTFHGSLSGAGSFTKTGVGVFTHGGGGAGDAWTYEGDTTVSEGALKFGANNKLPYGSGKGDLIVNGIIYNEGRTINVNGLSGTGTLTSTANYDEATWTVGNNDASSTFDGFINRSPAKSLTLNKVGTGTLTLTGANAIGFTSGGDTTAGVVILGGKVVAAHSGALGSYACYVDNGGVLEIANVALSDQLSLYLTNGATVVATGGAGAGVGSASRNITVDAGASATLATADSGDNLSLNGAIVGGDATSLITISGPGTVSLNAVNTYSGDVTVTAGTLLVNAPGSLAAGSAVVVESGATLGGDGTINDAITVNSGGTVEPGSSIGTLTLGASPTLNGAVDMEINKSGGVLTNDALLLTSGTLSYGGTLNVTASGDDLAGGDEFDLFDAPGFNAGSSFSVVNLPTLPVVDPALNWYTGNLTNNGAIVINRAPVANPATYVRKKGTSLKISISNLLTNTSDLDSDTTSLASVGTPTAPSQGSATISGSYIFYNPSGNGSDSFSYSIGDGRGGFANGVINIDVIDSVGALTITNTGGANVMSLYGIPGYGYVLQESCDMEIWTDIATNTANPSPPVGMLQFTNTPGCNPAFYRVRSL